MCQVFLVSLMSVCHNILRKGTFGIDGGIQAQIIIIRSPPGFPYSDTHVHGQLVKRFGDTILSMGITLSFLSKVCPRHPYLMSLRCVLLSYSPQCLNISSGP